MHSAGSDTGLPNVEWPLRFFRRLLQHGIDTVFISPGSRSTPLVLACQLLPSIKAHVVLDERSAAFLALGYAKATGKPAVLVCTSGTAGANYYPAVIEASMSGIPMLVCTADRPAELRGTGAPQTIDQRDLLGRYVRHFVDIPPPDGRNKIEALASEAVDSALSKQGPVHLNFQFRKPLEPKQLPTADTEALPGHFEPFEQKATPPSNEILAAIRCSKRPLVIAGPFPLGASGFQLPEWLRKAPLLAESVSQVAAGHASWPNLIWGFDSLLRNQDLRNELAPDLIIRLNNQPVSKGLELFFDQYRNVVQIAIQQGPHQHDANGSVDHFLTAIPAEASFEQAETKWLDRWTWLSKNFLEKRANLMGASDTVFSDGHVFSTAARLLAQERLISVSNSFPVRDMDQFAAPLPMGSQVLCNRGANGIDGVLSTAIGSALATEKDHLLLIGDLAFLHDTNALLSAHLISETQSFIVVVVNNGGGNIFNMLPVAQHEHVFNDYFITPQHARIGTLVNTYELGYQKVSDTASFEQAVEHAVSAGGFQVIECLTDSKASMKLRKDLWHYDWSVS